jgi:hypothetical protein
LIHRPILDSDYPHIVSASLIAVRDSTKCIMQILELLSEKKFGFAFCLNKSLVLVLAGFALVHNSLNSQREGMLAKENQKLLSTVLGELRMSSPCLFPVFEGIVSPVIGNRPVPDTNPVQSPSAPKLFAPSETAVQRVTPSIPVNSESDMLRDTEIPHSDGFQHDQDKSICLSLTGDHVSVQNQVVTYGASNFESFWPMQLAAENFQGSSPTVESNSAAMGDWERMLSMVDNRYTTHIYGNGTGNESEESGGIQSEMFPVFQQQYNSIATVIASERLQPTMTEDLSGYGNEKQQHSVSKFDGGNGICEFLGTFIDNIPLHVEFVDDSCSREVHR